PLRLRESPQEVPFRPDAAVLFLVEVVRIPCRFHGLSDYLRALASTGPCRTRRNRDQACCHSVLHWVVPPVRPLSALYLLSPGKVHWASHGWQRRTANSTGCVPVTMWNRDGPRPRPPP